VKGPRLPASAPAPLAGERGPLDHSGSTLVSVEARTSAAATAIPQTLPDPLESVGARPLRILVVNWQDRENPQAGGAETHLHEVFGRMARGGDEVTLLCSGFEGAPARATLDGIEVHRTGGRYSFALAARPYFKRHLSNRGFHVIVEDLNKAPVFTPTWSRTPVVLLVHHLFGSTAFQEASLPLATATWLLERPLSRVFADVPVIAVSQSTADDLVRRGFDSLLIRVVPNGVDLETLSPDPRVERFPAPTLLYLGRLKRYKRVDLVMRAVARLREMGVEGSLLVAGQGDHLAALEALSRTLKLEDRVRFVGFVPEDLKRDLLRRAWVHVLTSPKEGWGISILEAAACGTPTVASDSPGLRDAVIEGETGYLVPHGYVDALADRLAELLSEPDLRERMGRTARLFAERFSWDVASAEVRRVLVASVGRPPGVGLE
jgi:glycosyltransferase involved in cell wall biosynthesis